MSGTSPFLRQADPRRSLRARILVGFLLALLIPGLLFVFFLSERPGTVSGPEFGWEVLLAFASMIAATGLALFLVTRRFTRPIKDLLRVAEQIGQGRPVSLPEPRDRDELGRLAVALNRAGRRVERRVETLRRLHSLLRQEYHGADTPEILARSAEAIAAFTRAERVWFFLHDSQSNRLQAAWPAWNLSEDAAGRLQVTV